MKKIAITGLLALGIILNISAQTQQDTIFNYFTSTPVVVDGVDTEDCWDEAEWNPIEQVWLPYGEEMADGDFEGRFKVAWDADYLYLLVEVVDNMLSDDHSDPLDSWWDDDCLEIFIDEDRSKGWHETNNNAFAYHVSQFYDAIDMSPTGSGINYKDHIDVVMNDMGSNTYLWELAIRIYADDYNHSSPEDSRVTLTPNKVMGFTLAYCDNDETDGRENFIGSVSVSYDDRNVSYQTADVFGTMKLVDPDYDPVGMETVRQADFKVYPSPAQDFIHIHHASQTQNPIDISLFMINGQQLKKASFTGQNFNLNISDLEAGIYMLHIISSEHGRFSDILIKSD